MIKDALKFLEDKFNKGAKELERSSDSVLILTDDGNVSNYKLPKDTKSFCFLDLDSLMSSVDQISPVHVDEKMGSNAAVFVSNSSVRVEYDHTNPGNVCLVGSFAMPMNPMVNEIQTLTDRSPVNLVRTLRHDFHTATFSNDIVTLFSNVKFEGSKESSHNSTPTEVGVSRDVQERVSGTSDIPEEVTISFEVYPQLDELRESDEDTPTLVDIKCNIRVKPEDETISIIPFPGEVEKAIRKARNVVLNHISENLTNSCVYSGK